VEDRRIAPLLGSVDIQGAKFRASTREETMKAFEFKLTLAAIVMAFAISAGFSGSAKAGNVPESDDAIIVAINDWTGQIFQSYVFGALLEKMGYNVEYVVAGYYPQIAALADGNLTTTAELWSSNMGPGWDKWFDSGEVVDMGDSGAAATEGWYYNAKSLEMCPGLAESWEAIRECGEIWANPETHPKGSLVDYPIEWGMKNVTRIAALDLPLVSSPSGSEGGEVAAIISAFERGEPLLVVFWEPHWIMMDYDLIELPLPDYEEGCYEDPAIGINPDMIYDCGWPPTRLYKAAWAGMEEKWPAAFRLFENLKISGKDQAGAMKMVDVDGNDLHEYVDGWLADNESRWQPWIDDSMGH
jgi:glycine betaine/proline transport system substrate-binding protein